MNKESKYREQEKKKAVELIKNSQIFRGDMGRKLYPVKDNTTGQINYFSKADLLLDGKNNLYFPIVDDVILYFALNKIAVHHLDGNIDKGFCKPSGHTLSSQIACINHLFPLRYDKHAVLQIAKTICHNFKEVLEIDTDEFSPAYISFEYVNQNKKYLHERCETRGAFCTSIDAFVKANNVGIGIEWKYTETDYDTSKAKEYWNDKDHQKRYKPLLEKSNIQANYDVLVSCQMYYELMRQTLLLEQMAANNEIGDYLNIVVCPKENAELYHCCEKWKDNLKDGTKFKVIPPEDLLQNIDNQKYSDLIDYLRKRYW
jgi:hypothetical protein